MPGIGGCRSANANPRIVDQTIGDAQQAAEARVVIDESSTPSVKCSRFEIVNSATIAENPGCAERQRRRAAGPCCRSC